MNILVLSHRTDLHGPTESFCGWLRAQNISHTLVQFPFYYCADNRITITTWTAPDNREKRTIYGRHLDGQWSCIVRDIIYCWVIFPLLLIREKFDVALGLNPINVIGSVICKWLRVAGRNISWTIDWEKSRFGNRLANKIYHALDYLGLSFCDDIWVISKKIKRIRMSQLKVPSTMIEVVPVCVSSADIRQTLFDVDSTSQTEGLLRVALVGAVAPSKGVGQILDAFNTDRLRCLPVQLVVIGSIPDATEDGAKFPPYRLLMDGMDNVTYVGTLDRPRLLAALDSYQVGLSLHSKASFSRWADPSRIYDYAARGLAIIVNRSTEVGSRVQRFDNGVLIDQSVGSLVSAIEHYLLNPSLLLLHRNNSLRFIEPRTDNLVYRSALRRLVPVK